MSLQIEDDEAEDLKLKYGSALHATDEENQKTINSAMVAQSLTKSLLDWWKPA